MHYVKAMFIRIADGWSLRRVAEWLNAEHVPTVCKTNNRRQPAKGEWTASTVSQKIRNTVYKGQVRDSAHNFVRTCDPIVNSTLWRKANDRLDSAPTRRGKQNKANSAMLTSVLFCAGCGSAMYKSTSETRVYYRCAGKTNGRSCCMIRLSVLDDAVNAIMGSLNEPVTELVLIPGHNYEDELDLIKAQIKALDVDDPEYDDRHAALMAERSRLRSLDTVPDEWERRPVKDAKGNIVTHASRWAAFSTRDRGEWLQRHGFTFRASRAEVTVRQGDWAATLPLT
jgi:hypothetical protein